jgi:hypothetical protein
MDKPVIFYGAGYDAQNNCQSVFDKYTPVCFVDKDQGKYSELFMGKRVMSLERALGEYPDSLFYITSSKYRREINYELLNTIEAPRIINGEADLVKRLSCKILETSIGWEIGRNSFGLSFCCGVADHSEYPRLTVPQDIYYGSDDGYDKLAKFIKTEREELIAGLGKDGHICQGCPNLYYGIFNTKPEYLQQLNNNMKAACNCKCFYCNNPAEHLAAYSEEMRGKADIFDFVSLAEGLERCGLTHANTVYGWASGELTISRQKEKVFDYAKTHTFVILSNGLNYDERMAAWMADSAGGGYIEHIVG